MTETTNINFLSEEIDFDDSENGCSDDERLCELSDSGQSSRRSLDEEIESSKGYEIPITQKTADFLYSEAGTPLKEGMSEITVTPSPYKMTTVDEKIIMEAKTALQIGHDLDHFQVQSLLALIHGDNVVCIAPCGSGKLLVFYLGVYIMREKFGLEAGIGLCLQPLNNILNEKTNCNPPIKTAFLTMAGEGITSGNVKLSHSMEKLLSGEIGCLLGHGESFLSTRGNTCKQCNSIQVKTIQLINI